VTVKETAIAAMKLDPKNRARLAARLIESLREEKEHDPAYFQRFFVAGSTVALPNGADIAPETLCAYQESRHVA